MSLLLLLRGAKDTGAGAVVTPQPSKGGVYYKGILSNIWPLEAFQQNKKKAKKVRKLAEQVVEAPKETQPVIIKAIEANPELFLALDPELLKEIPDDTANILELIEALNQLIEIRAEEVRQELYKEAQREAFRRYILQQALLEAERKAQIQRQDEELLLLLLHELN